MIQLTTPTQQAMARIATAPATSGQGKCPPPLADRLAQAACPMRCATPCHDCRRFAAAVALELGQVLRERHGGSSQVADWLDGIAHATQPDPRPELPGHSQWMQP
jgi:hypothetical protein